jgi:hypothetical protein
VLGNGKVIRYGIGVGREGFTWSGAEKVTRMAEWPDWHPPEEMIERQPYLLQPGRLGACPGERPWIGDRDPNTCSAPAGLRLLTRSATNTYFPQVARVVSLPQTVDELARRIEAFGRFLRGAGRSTTSGRHVALIRR